MPDQPRLGLPAQAEKNKVVAGKYRVDYLRHHRVLKSEDAGEQGFAALDFADQIITEFVFDAAVEEFGFGEGARAKRAKGTG